MGTNLLLWGEDEFLLREAAREALGVAFPLATHVEGAEWVGGETADLATPSLFGEPRALLVSSCEALPNHAAEELARYLEAPAPDAHLVLTGRGVKAPPPIGRLKALIDTRRVELSTRELPSWVGVRAKGKGIPSSAPGAKALIDTIGERPAQLDQALGQLAAAFPGEQLTPALVERQFRGLGDRKTWEVADKAFAGDLAGAVRALAGMLVAREEPLLILGGVAARLRDLERVAAAPPRLSGGDLARAAGVRFDWQARRYREQAKRYSPGELASLHLGVAEADRALKNGASGDVVLPLLLARIARAMPADTRGPQPRAS